MENNYQLSRIHNYVNGLMAKEDMYALEREALEDPFLQDAIDGYKLQHGVDGKQLSLLQQRLSARIDGEASSRDKRFYGWQRLAIGAAAAVMFVTVCTLLLIRYLPNHKTVDMKEVVFKDAIFDYDILPINMESDAVPTHGWDELYEILNTKYSNSHNYEGSLDIRFDVDANKKANSIEIEGADFRTDEELADILRNKVKWDGSKGHFTLKINKINL